MEEKVEALLDPKLKDMNLYVYSVNLEHEGKNLFLRICLDSDLNIDLDLIVKATNIINPIMDDANLVDETYILEVYGKSKGDEINEKN